MDVVFLVGVLFEWHLFNKKKVKGEGKMFEGILVATDRFYTC